MKVAWNYPRISSNDIFKQKHRCKLEWSNEPFWWKQNTIINFLHETPSTQLNQRPVFWLSTQNKSLVLGPIVSCPTENRYFQWLKQHTNDESLMIKEKYEWDSRDVVMWGHLGAYSCNSKILGSTMSVSRVQKCV